MLFLPLSSSAYLQHSSQKSRSNHVTSLCKSHQGISLRIKSKVLTVEESPKYLDHPPEEPSPAPLLLPLFQPLSSYLFLTLDRFLLEVLCAGHSFCLACLSPDIHMANFHFCFKSLLVKCHLLSSNPHLNYLPPVCLKPMAQLVENLSTYRRHRRRKFEPWVRKIPWRRKLQLTSVFLTERSHVQRSLVGCSPWGHKESDMTEYNTQTKCFTSIF